MLPVAVAHDTRPRFAAAPLAQMPRPSALPRPPAVRSRPCAGSSALAVAAPRICSLAFRPPCFWLASTPPAAGLRSPHLSPIAFAMVVLVLRSSPVHVCSSPATLLWRRFRFRVMFTHAVAPSPRRRFGRCGGRLPLRRAPSCGVESVLCRARAYFCYGARSCILLCGSASRKSGTFLCLHHHHHQICLGALAWRIKGWNRK